MSKIKATIGLIFCAAFLLACTPQPPQAALGLNGMQRQERGELQVVLGGDLDASRFIQETANDVHHVTVGLTMANVAPQSKTLTKQDFYAIHTSARFSDLPIGEATVTVEAFDMSDFSIGKARATASIEPLRTTALTIALQIVPTYLDPQGLVTNISFLDGPIVYRTPGMISTYFGTGQFEPSNAGLYENAGDGWLATRAQVSEPSGLAVDPNGNLYVAGKWHAVRKVAPNGFVTTVAGTSSIGFSGDGGLATYAKLDMPLFAAVDSQGNLYVGDVGNNRVRKVTPSGTIATVAGNGTYGYSGDGGPATSAQIIIQGLAVDSAGTLYISGGNRVRRVAADGTITTVVGTGTGGNTNDTGLATAANITCLGIAFDSYDNLFIAAQNRIYVVWKGGDTISKVAGNGIEGSSGDGGQATAGQISATDLTVSQKGNVYFVGNNTHTVREVPWSTHLLQTVAGTGTSGYSGDNGPASAANLSFPIGVEIDNGGNLYIADRVNHRVRRVFRMEL